MSEQPQIVVTIEEQAPFVVELVAQQGPVGATGPQGIQGEPGLPGDAGQNGQDGQDGTPGPNLISTSTSSEFVGLVFANGVTVEAATDETIKQTLDLSEYATTSAVAAAYQPLNPFLTTLVGINSTTGTGALVRATSPALTTPNIGAATATSLIASGLVQGSALRIGNSNGQIDLSGTIVVFTNASAIRVGSNTLLTSAGAFRNAANSADAPISCSNVTASGIIEVNSSLSRINLKSTASGASAGALISFQDSSGTQQGYLYREPTSQKITLMNSVAGQSLVLGTGLGDRLTIFGNGNVSIHAGSSASDNGSRLQVNGSVTIGGGTAVSSVLSATATLDFGSIAASSFADLTMTVTGAAVGDVVSLGVPNGSIITDVSFFGWVSATNTVTIRASNNSATTARDPASGTFRATVIKF